MSGVKKKKKKKKIRRYEMCVAWVGTCELSRKCVLGYLYWVSCCA